MKALDLTGKRFGSLVAIESTRSEKGQRIWTCQCDCGNIKDIVAYSLVRGSSRSCGCLVKEKAINRNYRHGKFKTRVHRIWSSMKQRCYYKDKSNYKDYGGRGISMCDEWKDFTNFLNDMGERPKGTSIDRINVDLGYFKENCRWATKSQQANNKRSNCFIEYNNKRQTIAEWSKETGIAKSVIRYRLNNGYDLDKIFNKK